LDVERGLLENPSAIVCLFFVSSQTPIFVRGFSATLRLITRGQLRPKRFNWVGCFVVGLPWFLTFFFQSHQFPWVFLGKVYAFEETEKKKVSIMAG